MNEWTPVATELLGTWPDRVAAWGRDGLAAYVAVLEGRGVTPEDAIVAIRSYTSDRDFPPSAAKLAEQARHDASAPTFVEAYRLIFGPRGVLRARPVERVFADAGARGRAEEQAALDRASTMHPLVAAFVARQGVDRLRGLELDDPEYGPARRRQLEQEWNDHVDALDGRHVAALAVGRGRDGLHQLDPLAALGAPPPAALTTTTSDPGRGQQ